MIVQRIPGAIAISGPIPETAEHAHHALQITVSKGGTLRFNGEVCSNVMIDANVAHRLVGDDTVTLLIEPESHAAETLRTTLLAGTTAIINFDIDTRDLTAEGILQALLPDQCTERHLDDRVAGILDWFDTMQEREDWREISLEAALRRVHLSESRFLHLFKEETGIPWRRALVWRRAQVAIQLAARGKSLTEAAHAAGYADSAHLSRQFKSLFGLPPSVVLAISQFIQVPGPTTQ